MNKIQSCINIFPYGGWEVAHARQNMQPTQGPGFHIHRRGFMNGRVLLCVSSVFPLATCLSFFQNQRKKERKKNQ